MDTIMTCFEMCSCYLNETRKQFVFPAINKLTIMSFKKTKVWSLLAGFKVYVCQPFPNWSKGANNIKLQKKESNM